MKRNTFHVILGLVILAEVGVFWLAVEMRNALLPPVAFILGVAIIYLSRRRVEEVIEDERTVFITQKAAMRTLEIFWVVFFAISLGGAVLDLGAPGFPRPIRPLAEEALPLHNLGHFAVIQMALLALMILLYVGFRMYYARQYGEWDSDEEQN